MTDSVAETDIFDHTVITHPHNGGVYHNGSFDFTLRYPRGFTVDGAYMYQANGPGNDIPGIKFTISVTMATGTNLSGDSYLSVEALSSTSAQECTANLFWDDTRTIDQTITDGNTTYSFASSTGASAGNRYEETVYAFPHTSPCTAVRYFIHYGVFENYSSGTIMQLDENAVHNTFDVICRSVILR